MTRPLRSSLAALVALAGCATAGRDNPDPTIDAPGSTDAPVIDAPMIDAPCTITTTQLLVNPAFDTTPKGWTELPFNAMFPIITTDDGIPEDTPAQKAWMAGYAEVSSDSMYQDVVIPLRTSMLVLTGKYAIAGADSTTVVNDTATIQLTTPGGTQLAAIRSLDNTMVTAGAWATLDEQIPPAGLSGQTVRVMFRSQSNATLNTNFFFDSLALTASHCQ